ncbi:hypothetical protein [Tsukamurella sp. 1534]|uniref:hypothetical protein n=1 Tax=Tsukamurella sp. 1534 TaxID=1151061 RepID=UPI00031636EE|nr:hypothetical protein [Tsukamurella sp. 1534]
MDETKARREITFSTAGIPGLHATFTHEKAVWMAAPVGKARDLFYRAHELADYAREAQRALSLVVGRHPEMYPELRPVLVLLEKAAARVPWGTALDQEIAAREAARAAEKANRKRLPKFTH